MEGDTSRRMRWTEHVARMVVRRGAYRILVGKSEGKRPLQKPRCRWEDISKTDIQSVWRLWTGLIWLGIRRDVELLQTRSETSVSIKRREFC
jgi:hypothetical protein